MEQLAHISTRRAVQDAWDRYQALALVVSSDPVLAADPMQQIALRNAHSRWSDAFTKWDGR
jgi:hypothetical protein